MDNEQDREIKNLLLSGIAESDHLGERGSMSSIVGLDIHSEAGTFRINQKLAKDSGSTITEFVKDIVECSNGDLYFFSSESGKIWAKDVSAGTYSLIDTTAPTDGEAKCLGAIEYGGYIYWATQNWLHRIVVADVGSWSSNSEENWKALNEFDGVITKPPLVLRLNGVDQYAVTTSQQFGLTNADIFSFECWFRYIGNGAKDRCELLDQDDGRFKVVLGAYETDKPYSIRLVENGVASIASSDPDVFKSNEWTHLVITRNNTGAGNCKFYVNGVSIAVTDINPSNTFVDTACAKYIGTDELNAFSFNFQGDISVMNVYNGVLSPAEVTALYNGLYKGGSSATISWDYTGATYDSTVTLVNGADLAYSTDFFTADDEPRYPHFMAANTAIVEGNGSKKEILALQSPITKVKVYVAEKGAVDLTVVLHDTDNNSLASVTVTNANLTEGAWNTFDFTDFEIEYGVKIHAHVYASGAGLYLSSRNINNGADIALKIFSKGSLTAHPMMVVNRDLYIGDRNYVHKVTRNVGDGKHYFISNALDIPQPYQVECLGKFRNSLMVGASVGDEIHKSSVFLWDTWSVSFNSSDEIEEDGINAFIPADNFTYINAGKHGNMYYHDGLNLRKMRQIKGNYFPASGADVGVKINRNAATIYKGLSMFGLSNLSGNPALQGVYSWGNLRSGYPPVLNLEYPLSPRASTAFVFTNLEIGAMVVNSGRLYVSWRHNTDGAGTYAYGVDAIDLANKLERGYLETRYMSYIQELNKELVEWVAAWKSLPTGTALYMYFDEDYGGYGSAKSMVKDASYSRSKLQSSVKFNTLRVKFEMTSSNNSSPVIEQVKMNPRR